MVRKIVFGLLVALLGVSLIGIGYLIGYLHRATSSGEISGYPLVEEAHGLVNDHYLGEIPDMLILQRGMIQGMVSKLGDPFTTYVEPSANELQTDDLQGKFGGIGAHLTRDEQGYFHLIPYEDGPAARAGIREQYQLIAVDGKSIPLETGFDQVVSMIRGDIGSIVILTFQGGGLGKAEDFRLERIEFEIPSVTSYQLPTNQDIGVLIINRFSDRTVGEVEEAYVQLSENGVAGLVIDLRGNRGGILDAAIDVARFFLDHGRILIQTERDGEKREYQVGSPGKASDIPMVVLIDAATASASEVLAAALSENERAQLVGEQSFGKGSVQRVLSLSDGSSLHVTIARWLTPDGASIDGIGIKPDISTQPNDPSRDEILEEGVALLVNLIGGLE